MFENVLKLFTRTFWEPFTHPKRAAVLIASYFGMLGFGTMTFVSSFDFAGTSAAALETFLLLRVGGIAFLSIFFYLGFATCDGLPFRITLLALLLLSFGSYIALEDTPLLRGIMAGFLSALYWGSLHVAMTHNSTDDNRGHEVAVMNVLWMLGGMSASAIGAAFLEHHAIDLGVTFAIAVLLAATCCMLITSPILRTRGIARYIAESRLVWRKNHFFLKRSAVFALFESAGHMGAAYMSLLKFSPTMAATLVISRAFLEFAMAPIIGKISNQITHHNFTYGLILVGGSWIGLAAFATNELMFVILSLISGVGIRIMSSGINVKMYAIKSYAAIMYTELALGAGRIVGFIVMIPLLFISPSIYALAFAALSVIIFLMRPFLVRRQPVEHQESHA